MAATGKRKRVCVVGAGAAGLCALRHLLAGNSNFEAKCYEQTRDIGGTWVYKEETGVDEQGLPVHSSMYRDLRTNLPAKIMNFPDYPAMNAVEPCCVPHQEVLAYLRDYAQHFDILRCVQFGSRVESVRSDASSDGGEKWIVRVKDVASKRETETVFDAVMICNGHYFEPLVPTIPGMESFPGTVAHSHSYRKPEDFAGKRVLILGAAASGVDIAIDLAEHADRVYLSHDNERLNAAFPSNVAEVSGLDRIEGREIFLKDRSSVTADALMFCTGYRYSFPFLDENCGIRVDDNYVSPLYKHLINIEHPTMCIVGVPAIVVPFPMFHVQVQYFLALLRGKTSLPARPAMLEDSELRAAKKRHAHKLADKQWLYNDSLADAGGFDRLPAFYRAGYTAWSAQRRANLSSYKRARFVVSEDGESVQLIIPPRKV